MAEDAEPVRAQLRALFVEVIAEVCERPDLVTAADEFADQAMRLVDGT